MSDHTASLQSEALFRVYRAAVIAFNAASAPLILAIAAELLPTAQEISAEENALTAVVAARRNLRAVYEYIASKGDPAAGALPNRERSNGDGVWQLEDLETAPIG
jgi:hypothetical protein